MLTYLQVRDFAIIDTIELELRPGLTVLTGETGAGKSILVDALQLLAGGRAGAEVVRHGAERAEISGTFAVSHAARELQTWLEEQSISAAGELVVRRVVAADGRSRAYLNGQSVPLQLLREAGNILIDIHGQHEFQSLMRSAPQRELLDGYGRLEPLTGQVGIAHRVWLELLNRTLELESRARDRDAKLELLRYQVQELTALQLKAGEVEKLARKNRVAPAELPERARHLAAELEALERAELDLAVLRKDLGAALETYRAQAGQLSQRRAQAGRALAKDITARMQTLGMSGGRFQVEVVQNGNSEPTQHGVDQIEFSVTANPGQPLRALAKVASGGELSRLSLAVQVSCAARETRCMVFDEVDAGIGGAVAEIVGRELRSLGERGQVLCVTHLPQVPSQGHHQLRVTKLTDGRTTRTAVSELAAQDRVEELARMLGGIEVTSRAREHAKEMLKVASPVAVEETSRQPRPSTSKRR